MRIVIFVRSLIPSLLKLLLKMKRHGDGGGSEGDELVLPCWPRRRLGRPGFARFSLPLEDLRISDAANRQLQERRPAPLVLFFLDAPAKAQA